MANTIKYSLSNQTKSLKKGNFWIGTDSPKGPTVTNDYWNGIDPPNGGYTIYINKASQGPSIYPVENDANLISLTNLIAGASYTTVAQCLDYYASQTDKMIFNRNLESIVTDGLVLYYDANIVNSYPRTGTLLYDLSPTGINTTISVASYSTSGFFDSVDSGLGYSSLEFTTVLSGTLASTFAVTTGGWCIEELILVRDTTYPETSCGSVVSNSAYSAGQIGFDWNHGQQNITQFQMGASDGTQTGSGYVVRGYITLGAQYQRYNVWYLRHIYWNRSTNRMGVYYNGVYQGDVDISVVSGNPLSDGGGIYWGGLYGWRHDGSRIGMRVYNRILTTTEILNNYQSTLSRLTGRDIVTNGLSLYLDAGYNGSFTVASNSWFDISGKDYTGTLTNGATYSSTQGGSISFDGTNDYVTFGDVIDFNTSDFSLAVWVYIPSGTSNTYKAIINKKGENANDAGYGLYYNTGMQKFLWSTANGGASSEIFTTNTFGYIEDTWAYVVMYRKNGDTNNGGYYVNGVYQSLASSATVLNVDSVYNLSLAVAGSTYTPYCFQGKISNVQIYNRALSSSEILQNYQNTLTRFLGDNIIVNGLVLYLDAGYTSSFKTSSNTWYDISGYGNNSTLTNGATYSSGNGGSILFDGVNDYVNVPYSSILAPTTSLSFEAWAFKNDWLDTTNQRILSKTQVGGYQLSMNEGSLVPVGSIGISCYYGGAYRSVYVANSTISSGWNHFTGTCDGRYLKFYINGSNVGTYDLGSQTVIAYSVNNSLLIGAEPGSGSTPDGQYFTGNISIVRIYNKSLSQSEILQNFNAQKARYGL